MPRCSGVRPFALPLVGCLVSLAACDPSDSLTAPDLANTDGPVITALDVPLVAATEVVIVVATNQPAVSLVEYGTTGEYGQAVVAEPAPKTSHRFVLKNLEPATTYLVRVTAQDGTGAGSTSRTGSFVTAASGTGPTPSGAPSIGGIWIGRSELDRLAMSGSAWASLRAAADGSCGTVDLSDQTQMTNVCVMAKALAFARTGASRYRTDVVAAISQIVSAGRYEGRALALGRELGAYVIAADLIDLKSHDPVLDGRFRTALVTLRTTYTSGAAENLIDCHEKRPNNWGAHCGATRAAIAVYLGDTAELQRTAQVFKGYLGDRSSYAGFSYGGPAGEQDLSWQCNPRRPVGINPAGCVRDGVSLDGVLPDDQRRGGSFTRSPPKEEYVWEALQGLLAQAVILHRAGYPVWEWEDRALLRAVNWLHDVVAFPAEGDDTWQPHILNHYYGSSFPAPVPSRAGKNVGWTDWTHRN